MASPIQMERWRRQFSACCGVVAGKAKPLTGCEKMALEGSGDDLDAIEVEYQKNFGPQEGGAK
jgi:hypothetical protein